MKAQYGQIHVTEEGDVARLTIDSPPHNHASVALMRDLATALADIDQGSARVTVLTAAGKSFCGGADLVTPSGLSLDDVPQLYEQAARICATKKPVIAAVQGAAVGAGLGLTLVADFRIAAPEARFSANFVKLGFHPGFGITYTLPRLIGPQKAALMCLTGRRIRPEEALAWGLVDEVVPQGALVAAAMRLAQEIAENAPLAVQATRATLRADLAAQFRAQTACEYAEQSHLRTTADFAEGIKAVAERRPGKFRGV